MEFLNILKSMARMCRAFRYCRMDALLLEGKETHSGQPMRIFYFGKRTANFHWITNQVFSEFEIRKSHTKEFFFNMMRRIREYENDADLVVLDAGYFGDALLRNHRDKYLRIPYWVGMKREVGGSMEELSESFRKCHKMKFINRIMKNNITCRTVRDEKYFAEFYLNYFLPQAIKRFGNMAQMEEWGPFLQRCGNGVVMQILHKEEVVAYTLLDSSPNHLTTAWSGISQDIDPELAKNVSNAIYYYALMYALEKGCDEVDFMYSRPLMQDGVYVFKRRWGANLYKLTDRDRSNVENCNIFIRPVRFNDSVINFFSNHYFMTNQDNRLESRVLCPEHEVSAPFIERLMKDYYAKGMEAVKIYAFGDVNFEVAAWARENAPPVEIVSLGAGGDPQQIFCS